MILPRLWAAYREPGFWWFRVCGFGLRVADRRRHRALFSERTGVVRVWRVGPWSVRHLTPKGWRT